MRARSVVASHKKHAHAWPAVLVVLASNSAFIGLMLAQEMHGKEVEGRHLGVKLDSFA